MPVSRKSSGPGLKLTGESSTRTSPPALGSLDPRLFPARSLDTCVVNPVPVLYWPLPGHIPPPQRAPSNRLGVIRSSQAGKLRSQLDWSLKCGLAQTRPDPCFPEKRAVVIQTWKKGRLYDHGNYVQSCKALLDSLQPDYLWNDSVAWCLDFYWLGLASSGVEAGTLVLVLEILRVNTIEALRF